MTKNINELFDLPSPFTEYNWPSAVKEDFESRKLKLFIKRDDLIDSEVSGNKLRKLKYNVLQAQSDGKSGLLTFGGAYSNHLLATASLCHKLGLKSLGIVRGEELNENSNDNLKSCAELGMTFRFISREEYRLKEDWEYLMELKSEFSEYKIVAEGGKNFFGIIGCQEITKEIKLDFDDIWVSQGTCTTSVGVLSGLQLRQKLNVVPALKGFDSKAEMKPLLMMVYGEEESTIDKLKQVDVYPDFHFGGYGKTTHELEEFICLINKECGIPLDKVYTSKTFYALIETYKNNDQKNKNIVMVHTGGLLNG
ncbi:MAG: 1-aminocyclopropane-1-carboxylate deaminase [Lentimonas sp.]|jgi:1-aminocyclopropane-1-carboxylate deaminase